MKSLPNKSDAVNPLMALRFAINDQRRRVTDPERSQMKRMNKSSLTLFLVAGIMIGCRNSADAPAFEGTCEGVSFVGISEENASNAHFMVPAGATLRTPDLAEATSAMPKIRAALHEKSPRTAVNFTNYQCQVVGTVSGGSNMLCCHFISKSLSGKTIQDWKRKPVILLDGGDMTFQADYDIQSGRCVSVSIPPPW
jgi:hypothetical protein